MNISGISYFNLNTTNGIPALLSALSTDPKTVVNIVGPGFCAILKSFVYEHPLNLHALLHERRYSVIMIGDGNTGYFSWEGNYCFFRPMSIAETSRITNLIARTSIIASKIVQKSLESHSTWCMYCSGWTRHRCTLCGWIRECFNGTIRFFPNIVFVVCK